MQGCELFPCTTLLKSPIFLRGSFAFIRPVLPCGPHSGFSSIRFSTVVIDEATQATEAAALVPIIRGCQQLILVGDQNQVIRFVATWRECCSCAN